jgi:peptide/nickel transport system substrate-binding protein
MFKVRERLRGKLLRYSTVLAASAVVVATAAACNASGGGSKSNGSAPPLQFGICCAWGATWSYNPYTAFFPGVGNDFVLQTLAMQNPPKLTNLIPQLADKWTTKGDTITAHIRTGAKWSDGTALTSTDVLDTILLNGTNGNVLWNDITDVTAPSANEISVKIRKGVPAQQTLIDLLTQTRPFPASVYGKYVTPGLKAQLLSYYNEEATNPSAAAKSPAKTTMTKIFSSVVKASPKNLLGDGPYKLITMNTQQAKLVKSDNYYNAAKISVPEVTYVNGQQTDVLYGYLTSGRLDFSNVYLPEPIAQKFTHTPNSQVALPPSFEYAMYFNSAKYPLSITKVRQALAYAMPRKDMIDAAYGTTNPGGVIEDHPDGLDPGVEKIWLTKQQINSLNKYPHDLSKATALLKSAGFKQNGKQWIMPNGKPFTLSFEVNSATTDIITSFKAASSALSDFGIKSEVTAVPGTKQSADQQAGNFEIGQGFPNNLNPIAEIEGVLGQGNNFTTLGNYKGQKGIGYGPTVDVPGQGKVDVPTTIDKQAHSTPPGPQMSKLAWSWAQLVNRDVPFLQYGNKVYQFSFTTTHYKNWPSLKDPLWNLIAYNMNGGFVHAQEEGYIQPR